jgi:hypothetical protein
MAKIIGYIGAAVVGAAVAGSSSYWKYLNPPSTQQRWSNKTQVTPNATPAFTELQSKDLLGQRWKKPTISVYSAPYHAPQPVHFTLKDLSNNGQAHAIDFTLKRPMPSAAAWQKLTSLLGDDANASARIDPYRVDRILVATVTKGLDTLPGDRLLWTRVFVEPINFEFAGYTIADTDNKSIKLTSIENSINTKLSIKDGAAAEVPVLGKPEFGQELEKTQKATAEVNEQYENLGIDIQPDYLRIIRESATGGDVAGNTRIRLTILTDPSIIWCRSAEENKQKRCKPTAPAAANQGTDPDDKLVLVVSNVHLADGEKDPRIDALPQSVLPHCPLKANVRMLYEMRNIANGRENLLEGSQQVALSQDADSADTVDIVPADDIAPAVWSIKVTDAKPDARANLPVTADASDLFAQIDNGSPRKLVFTDYLTASELAHWLKTQLAASPRREPKLKKMTFHIDSTKTLTPFKNVTNDCGPRPQLTASN